MPFGTDFFEINKIFYRRRDLRSKIYIVFFGGRKMKNEFLNIQSAGVASLSLTLLAVGLSGPAAAKDCGSYANTAVTQFVKNVELQCGFAGPAWSNDYGGHLGFCLLVDENISQLETDKRAAQLSECQAQAGNGANNNNNQAAMTVAQCAPWAAHATRLREASKALCPPPAPANGVVIAEIIYQPYCEALPSDVERRATADGIIKELHQKIDDGQAMKRP